MSNHDSDWSKTPFIVLISVIASCIAIFAFITGKQSIPDILSTNPPRLASTNTLVIYSPTPNEHIIEGSPSDWVPNSEDIPSELSNIASTTNSNEDIAKNYDNPTEVFKNLEEWGRITGYFAMYAANDFRDTCTSETGLISASLQSVLYKSALGADKGLEFSKSRDNDDPDLYRQEDNNTVGDRTYSSWFEFAFECSTPNGKNNIRVIRYTLLFRRYNVLGYVTIDSVKDVMSESDSESLALRLARLIDLRLVAEAK